jgi:hypothetical protein
LKKKLAIWWPKEVKIAFFDELNIVKWIILMFVVYS